MIIFVYGEDTFRARQHVRESVLEFKKKRDPAGYNVVEIDAAKAEGGMMLTELSSAPFMAEKRMVVLNNLLSNSDVEAIEAIGDRLKNLPEYLIAIVVQNEKIGKTKIVKELYEVLKKEKFAREFALLERFKLEEFANNYVKEKGGSAAAGVVGWLVAQCGNDLWLVTSTLDQLIAFSNGRPITQADVGLFVNEKVDDNIFHVVEAIVSGATPLAYKLIAKQNEEGKDAQGILALIAWQMRILLALADAIERDPSSQSDTLAKELKLHPFVVKKNMALARRMPLAKLEARFKELLNIDKSFKTGVVNAETLLDVFVAR